MKSTSKILMVVSLVLIFVFMSLAAYFNSGNGTVIRNVYYPDAEGNVLRGQLFIPDGVSSSNPAPGILNMHGGGDHLECVGNFSLELARRGYVVLSVDAYGSGFSDRVAANVTAGAGSGNKDSSALKEDGGATVGLRQLFSYDFVDQDNIGLIGHSMGGTFIANAALAYPDKVKAILPWGSGSFIDMLKLHESSEFTFNVGYINAQYDEMVLFASHLRETSEVLKQDFMKEFFGVEEDIVAGEIYGSFVEGNARVIYAPSTSHVGNIINAGSIGDLLSFFEKSMPTATTLASTDQVWQLKEFFSMLAIIALVFFAISLGIVLLSGNIFGSLVSESPRPSMQINGLVRWIGILVLVAIPILTLHRIGLPLATIKASKLFPMNWGNYFAWIAVVNAGIILVLFAIWHFVYGKKHGGNLQSYGLFTQSIGSWLLQIGKAIGFAVVTVFSVFLIVNICYAIFKIDFRFWIFGIKPITAVKLQYIWGYFLMFFIAFGALNMASVSFMSISNNDSSKWGAFKQYAIAWLIGAGGFVVVLLVYYIGLKATHYPPFFVPYPPFADGHPNALVYSMKMIIVVPMFTIASVMNTAFYRKTRNIYVGWFTAALFVAMVTLAGNAFSF